MKLFLACFVLFLSYLAFAHSPYASAKFACKQTRLVPIARLLKNIQTKRSEAVGRTDKAMIDFRMGRLNAMAYALRTEEARCDAAIAPGSAYELPDFGYTPDHLQFSVMQNSSKIQIERAKKHLADAIKNMEAALKTDPSLLAARLGLAWCYEQAGNKTKAITLYREVVRSAYRLEENSQGGMMGWSITVEAAGYLHKLLDPVKDKKEIDSLDEKVALINKLPRYVTPIAVALSKKYSLDELVQNKSVYFDLDGFGTKKYKYWISPKAAWLVYDPCGSGNINSGLSLIGGSSFWLFWQNGYQVLEALDNNHDGILRNDELNGLALWQDLDSDAVSDKGEVRELKDWGIIAIKTSAKKHRTNILFNESGIVLKSGINLATYDLILPTAPLSSDKIVVPKNYAPVKNIVF